MGVFDSELFLGFEIGLEIQDVLDEIPEKKETSFFKQAGDDAPAILESQSYLGKCIIKSLTTREMLFLKQRSSNLAYIILNGKVIKISNLPLFSLFVHTQ